ncbi:MAG: nucleoside hydrolase [Acidimicrobiales bacterium]|nr:ribonucleoside hydrolase [Acidimicrobiaceae bacterium]MDP6323420.1 nucleoside hydrolase [Acidimicrobiales bacterium]MDP6893851.1 nucleoside hydrolase [Acidimicrobiales bacterium]HJM37309.1 nucleoside hydrolase [Acidimicrobiales bacterium]
MTTDSKPKIILDCDPGVDDAIAIITACRWTEIIGITSVSGNVSVEHTTSNALKMKELLNIEAPIHIGASRPIASEPFHASHVHGQTGLGNTDLPEPDGTADSDDAVAFILEKTREEEGIHLIPIGPLTNIALAIKADPSLVNRVASITLMGGGAGIGNVTSAAEFNVFADPEAADLVFRSGAPLNMLGLNLTHQVLMGSVHADYCYALNTPVGKTAGDLLNFNGRTHGTEKGANLGAMHDPCAVLAVTHPDLFTSKLRSVVVELEGSHTRGQTLVDEREWVETEKNCNVYYEVDSEKVIGLILQAVSEVDPNG